MPARPSAPAALALVLGLLAKAGLAARVQDEAALLAAGNSSEDGKPECGDLIDGGRWRSSAYRRKLLKCKCPYNWVVAGDDDRCEDVRGTRNYPLSLAKGVCRCEYPDSAPKDYVPMDSMVPNFNCGAEYTLGEQDDLADNAYSWCDSRFVPEEKRVPPQLRGLYWMYNLTIDDVAFCTSLAEWDEKTLTARLAVWTHFVIRKKPEEKVPHLSETVAKLPVVGGPLIYTLAFTDATYTSASITTNLRLANALINFPLTELDETPGGEVKREQPGDIFDRPSFFFGVQAKKARYYAVRIMDDAGNVHRERYNLMKEKEAVYGGTLMRYAPRCSEAPYP